MITENGNGFYSWNGKMYQSDIVRACVHPKVKAIGKLTPRHIRNTYDPKTHEVSGIEVNPEPYMRFLLEEPNPYMTMQKLLEKVGAQLTLNRNAFILIIRDNNGFPTELYPIPAAEADFKIIDGEPYLKCYFDNGHWYTFRYSDIIHLREDYNENDIFGTGIAEALAPLMEIVTATDQGIVKAIKNSSIIRWLLKFTTSMRKEDLEKQAKDFSESFLAIQNSTGVAAIDSKTEAKQIDPKDYVPNAAQMDRTVERIRSLFNTNGKIVQSNFTGDEWTAYYEQEIEPVAIDLNSNFTIKLFTRKQRSFGNKVVFGAINLTTASMSEKLGLQAMVDRGAMIPNEWRAILGLAPIEGGDKPIRRLDTAVVNGIISKFNGSNSAEIINLINALESRYERGEINAN
nr:MAG TPA: portal protein [Caudoviricetes sp.]